VSDFSVIPSIDRLRQRPGVRALEAKFGADATVDALRTAAASARQSIAGGGAASSDTIEAAAAAWLGAAFQPSLVPVINATGVVIHTNLGRAPLSATSLGRVVDVASVHYSHEN
jgi:L-seryl-tRNA(Ser) seleniumtransferase